MHQPKHGKLVEDGRWAAGLFIDTCRVGDAFLCRILSRSYFHREILTEGTDLGAVPWPWHINGTR
jgi:hypothetical protein